MSMGGYSEIRPLAGDVDGLKDDEESQKELPPPSRNAECRTIPCKLVVLASVGLILLSGLAGVAVGVLIGSTKTSLDTECAAYTTQHSPVLDDVDVKYQFKSFNGSFLQEEVYRLPAAPEVDAAWEALGVDYRAGVISEEEGLKSGLTHAHVQRAEKYGGGFFVNVEGLHHLHCLNLLRKSMYYNYDYYKAMGTHAFMNDDRILQLHVSHCLDILRQVLMCTVDTGVLGQVWFDKSNPTAFPDFNTRHKCKNYDDIRQWAEEHQAEPPETLPPDYMRLPEPHDVLVGTP